MTIKEFFEIDFSDFEEIEIYKDNDNNLITHSYHNTETIIELYGHYEIKQFWVHCKENDFYFVFIV